MSEPTQAALRNAEEAKLHALPASSGRAAVTLPPLAREGVRMAGDLHR